MNFLLFGIIVIKIRIRQILGVILAIVRNDITRYPPSVTRFEENFASYIGKKYALTFCNGTSAIEAALFAIGVGEGDEVLVPSCTFHASIDPIVNVGAVPVFVDVDPLTFVISIPDVAAKVTKRTKAVIVVHLFGTPADMDALNDVIGDKIAVIEDASHAHGAKYHDRMCGACGDYGVFSLQGDKAVAGGEGGVVLTDDREGWIRMSMWGHFERHGPLFPEIDAEDFCWTGFGYKRRMAPLSAVLASVELDYLDKKNQLFRKNTRRLDNELAQLEGIVVAGAYAKSVKGGLYAGYPICINKGKDSARRALKTLKKYGILAYPWPYKQHHKIAAYVDPNLRLSMTRRTEYDAGSLGNFQVYDDLPETERLDDHGIILSKKYLATLNSRTLDKIKRALNEM